MASTAASAMATTVKSKKDLAFTIYLDVYDPSIEDRVLNQYVVYKDLRNSPSNLELKQQISASTITCPPLQATEQELNTTASNPETHGIVVGLYLPDVTTTDTAGALKNNSVDSLQSYNVIATKPKAFRVIAARGKNNSNLYILANQEHGICTGFHIKDTEAFFYSEFRNDAVTAAEHRKNQWKALVRKKQTIEKDNQKFSTSYDKIKFLVDVPKKSAASEVISLLATYEETGDASWLKQCLKVLNELDPDLQHKRSIIKNVSIHKMITKAGEITIEDCYKVAEEIEKLWSEIDTNLVYNAELIHRLCKGLVKRELCIGFRLFRAWFVLAARELSMVEDEKECYLDEDSKELAKILEEAYLRATMALGPVPERTISLSHGTILAYLDVEIDRLSAIHDYSCRQVKELKDSQGDHNIAGSLPSIWATYAARPDVDSTKNLAMHVHRFNVNHLAASGGRTNDELAKHIQNLKDKKAAIEEAAS